MDIQRINPREWNCSAAVFGDLVFLSGTVADDKSLDMKGQTAEVLKKIDAVLAKAGTDKSRILSATVYMRRGGNQSAFCRHAVIGTPTEHVDPYEPGTRPCHCRRRVP